MIFDVLIAGGGAVGLAAAALLNDAGASVCVLEPRLEQAFPSGPLGLRSYALTPAARRLLEVTRAWSLLDHTRIGQFTAMDVWDAGSAGRLEFEPPPGHLGAMGYIVEHANLVAALAASVATRPGVRIEPQALDAVEIGRPATVLTMAGQRLKARLVVGADGAGSRVRAALAIEHAHMSYRQTALVCNLRVAEPHRGVARQRFLPTGPLAALPLPGPCDCAIVWSLNDDEAAATLALDDQAFCAALAEAFDGRFGEILNVSERAAFPLARARAAQMVHGNCVLLGDAAHLVHPLAGQGLNLGLLDAASLAECVGAPGDAAWPALGDLRRFERWRKSETLAMLAVTDGLHRLFQRDEAPLRHLRGLGMRLTDGLAPLKHLLIRHAMGTAGDVPALLRPPPRR